MILNQRHPTAFLITDLPKIHLNASLPSPRSSKRLFPTRFVHQSSARSSRLYLITEIFTAQLTSYFSSSSKVLNTFLIAIIPVIFPVQPTSHIYSSSKFLQILIRIMILKCPRCDSVTAHIINLTLHRDAQLHFTTYFKKYFIFKPCTNLYLRILYRHSRLNLNTSIFFLLQFFFYTFSLRTQNINMNLLCRICKNKRIIPLMFIAELLIRSTRKILPDDNI